MTTPRLASAVLCVLLVLPGAALAKVGHEPMAQRHVVLSAVSRGAAPGDPWSALITVRAEGGGRVIGVNPVLSLIDQAGGRYFAVGQRTETPGTYRARLPAPTEGVYRVSVDDGLGVEHAAGTTRVLNSAAGSRGGAGGGSEWALPLGIAVAFACLVLLAAVRRARGDAPSSGMA